MANIHASKILCMSAGRPSLFWTGVLGVGMGGFNFYGGFLFLFLFLLLGLAGPTQQRAGPESLLKTWKGKSTSSSSGIAAWATPASNGLDSNQNDRGHPYRPQETRAMPL